MTETESELVVKVAQAGMMSMAEAADEFSTSTMIAASMHILATWIAVESDYTDIGESVRDLSKQLRQIIESHLSDPVVLDLKAQMQVRGTH